MDDPKFLFPLAGPTLAFGVVHCVAAQPSTDDPRVALVIGEWSSRTAEAQETLAAARADRPEWLDRRVRVRFRIEGDPTAEAARHFDGGSWQLALAIADRLLLEGVSPTQRIFATGTLVRGGHGAIGPVGGLDTKIGHVLEAAEAGDAFLFPAACAREMTLEAEAKLRDLRKRGTIVHAATAMPELGFLWWRRETGT